jgi:hypothetical protein
MELISRWKPEIVAQLRAENVAGGLQETPSEAREPVAQNRVQKVANVIALLDDQWRIIDIPGQWVLQRLSGIDGAKNRVWANRLHYTSRASLPGHCRGNALARALVEALPEWHPRARARSETSGGGILEPTSTAPQH